MNRANKNIVNVIIADDHPMLLSGLKQTLSQSNIKVLGMAKDGTSALQLILDYQPDLAIIDIDMPYLTGFAIAEEIMKRGLGTKFIILSYHKEAEYIARAKKLNISGYLLKEDTTTEIFNCIHQVMEGNFYYSKSIIGEDLKIAHNNLNKLTSLSPSEKKILKLIASSFSSQKIAEKLQISERTVEKHRSNIISKLGLSGQAHGLSVWASNQKAIINTI